MGHVVQTFLGQALAREKVREGTPRGRVSLAWAGQLHGRCDPDCSSSYCLATVVCSDIWHLMKTHIRNISIYFLAVYRVAGDADRVKG